MELWGGYIERIDPTQNEFAKINQNGLPFHQSDDVLAHQLSNLNAIIRQIDTFFHSSPLIWGDTLNKLSILREVSNWIAVESERRDKIIEKIEKIVDRLPLEFEDTVFLSKEIDDLYSEICKSNENSFQNLDRKANQINLT